MPITGTSLSRFTEEKSFMTETADQYALQSLSQAFEWRGRGVMKAWGEKVRLEWDVSRPPSTPTPLNFF